MKLIQVGKYLIVLTSFFMLNLSCSSSKKPDMNLNGRSLEFVIDKLGKPISCHEFILSKKLYEYQYKLLTYFPEPEGKNILIKELLWEMKKEKTVVWFHKVDNKWKSIDNLSWNTDLIKY
jgi:hypothetical protein